MVDLMSLVVDWMVLVTSNSLGFHGFSHEKHRS